MLHRTKLRKPRKLRSFLIGSSHGIPLYEAGKAHLALVDSNLPKDQTHLGEGRDLNAVDISRLASEALRRVAFTDDLVARLIDASLSNRPGTLKKFADEIHASGLSKTDLVTGAIPTALMELGDAWMEDRMSWVDVTVASSRLQILLSDIDLRPLAEQPDPARILILVPAGEDHTISAAILQKRFQLLGHFADVIYSASTKDIEDLQTPSDYAMIAFSVHHLGPIPVVEDMIAALQSVAPDVPRIMGGYALSLPLPKDLSLTLLTTDLSDALHVAKIPMATAHTIADQDKGKKNDT